MKPTQFKPVATSEREGRLRKSRWRAASRVAGSLISLTSCFGCRRDMFDQPRVDVYESSTFFGDGKGARMPVVGTVARGSMDLPSDVATGRVDGEWIRNNPIPLTSAQLQLGEQRYNEFCALCHAYTGTGNGMIVQRGFQAAASFHTDRLRSVPDGHIYDVVTQGLGAMPSYASQLRPHDRWAVVAYVRALQLSQSVDPQDLSAAEQKSLPQKTP